MLLTKKRILFIIYIVLNYIVFFAKWMFNKRIGNYVGLILPIAILFVEDFKIDKKSFYTIMLFFLYVIINLLFTRNNSHNYFIEELLIYTLPNIFVSIALFKIFYNCKESIINSSFYFFNYYFIINSIIMMIQTKIIGFMIFHYANNTFYPDHITGMIGPNGTHRLSIFYLILLYINLLFINEKGTKGLLAKIMFVYTLLFSIIFSTVNDNRAYYFMLVLFFIPIINKVYKKSLKKIRYFIRILLFIALIGFAIVFLYKFNDNFKNFVDIKIVKKVFERTTESMSNLNNFSEERLILFKYSLEHSNPLIGKGIGNVRILADENMPKHFGISEITARVYNGGILYLIVLVILYFTIFISSCKTNKKKLYLFIGLFILFMSFYQQIFTITEETILFSILLLLIIEYVEGKNEN